MTEWFCSRFSKEVRCRQHEDCLIHLWAVSEDRGTSGRVDVIWNAHVVRYPEDLPF